MVRPEGLRHRATKCFVYDDGIKSIIGLEASFGSDELNDHHFHYGYMLYAAAVVAKNDRALADKWRRLPICWPPNRVPQATADFPQYRNFDPYSGHAWASGSSPFADGNNQESSSESVNAWNALAMWEKVRGNTGHVRPGRLDDEHRGQLGQALLDEHGLQRVPGVHPQDRRAQLGRQAGLRHLVQPRAGRNARYPADPNGFVLDLPGRRRRPIKANLAEAAPGGYGAQFGEYMVQYLALADPAAAREQLANLPAEIDNGTTKSYVMAFVFSQPSPRRHNQRSGTDSRRTRRS